MGVGGSSPLNPTKSTQRECFFFVLSCPWTIASSTAFGRRTTFRSARCAFASTFARLLLSESTQSNQKHSARVLFLCPIVSLDDCIVHCLWQANHLSVCTLRFCKYICSLAVERVHSIQPKALSASAFSLSYRVLGRLHRPLPLAGEPPFGLHAALLQIHLLACC